MNISTLTQKRREHVQSCQLNGDHSHSIIANLYSDSTHFLYELLQNAQDAEATSISFTLYPDRLITSHDGRAFNYGDVEAITTIGSSTKSTEANKIGKFGAGFKSVFSITNTPQIHSTPYHFQISDYIIPSSIEPFEGFTQALTTVILPFDKQDIDNTLLYHSIERRLKSIGKDEVIFLSNLKRISWQIGELSGCVEKHINEEEGFRSLITIRSDSQEEVFELYVRDFIIDEKPLQTKIAFAMDEDGYYKSTGNSYPLFVFFPTVVQTNVQFLVHAPYKTTPNRETINFTDSQNQEITNNISALYESVVIDMADRKRLDVATIQILPISSNNGEIAQKLFQASIKLFKSHPLIPTREDSYALPEELFYLSANLDSELFYTAQIQTLFKKSVWISETFNKSSYSLAKQFVLAYLNVPEIKLNDIVNALDEAFLLRQSNTWIGKLYGEFPKAQAHVNIYLSSRPLARLEDGRHIPFKSSNGETQVYLHPGTASRFECLSQEICAMLEAKAFLGAIGIKSPDVIDEIKMFILSTSPTSPTDTIPYNNYCQIIENIVRLYNTASTTDQKRIIDLMEKTNCIFARKADTYQLRLPKEIYLPTDSLKRWFVGNTNIWVLEAGIGELLEHKHFLEALSCKIEPEVLKISPHINTTHKENLRHTSLVREMQGDDFEWVGLESVVQQPMDAQLSLILWNFLGQKLVNTNILRGYYRWQGPDNTHEEKFDSKICSQLKQTAWLLNKEGILCKPLELKPEELADLYGYDNLGVELKEKFLLLGFKTDAIKEIEKLGYRVIAANEAEAYDAFKQLQAQLNTSSSDEAVVWDAANPNIATWISEVEPSIEANIEKIEFMIAKKKDLQYQTPQSFFEDDNEEEEYIRVIPKSVRKSIGDWSEQYVHHYLQTFCEDNKDKNYTVRWMNENGSVGQGYDFVLMKGEKELRYIEVKGRTSNTSEIEISKTQWEFAKFLFDKEEGAKYSIFIVQNAGKSYAKLIPINNPVKMWLDGNLSMLKIELRY